MAADAPTFKVKANDFVFELNQASIDAVDVVKKSPADYNLIKNHRSVNARVLEADVFGKRLRVEVDGESFDVEIKDELDQMLDSLGFSTVSARHIKVVKAPMPGMVLNVAVVAGQEVKEGDRLLILEAMKMENSILIHTDGKIKYVAVSAGQPVDKGQVLVELE